LGYREEGTFGPGGKKFVAVGASILVVGVGGYFGTRALEDVDLEGLVDPPELETESGEPLIDIPELPEFEVPDLNADNPDPRTPKGFAQVVESLRQEVGPDAPLVRVAVTLGGVDFHLRDGDKAFGYSYSSIVGELQPVQVRVTGPGSLRDEDFPLSDLSPKAIARIDRGLKNATADRKAELVSAVLDPIPALNRERWVITADANGESGLVFEADFDGANVRSFGEGEAAPGVPSPPPIPQPVVPDAAQEAMDQAQKVFDCIEAAGGDVQQIQECAQLAF
jgi:hypothetical protein